MASLDKLTNNPQVIEMFQDWGYPSGFYKIIGILEIAGAILILIPKTSYFAAMGLIAIMAGALATHLLHDPIANVLRPLIFMLFLGAVVYLTNQKKS